MGVRSLPICGEGSRARVRASFELPTAGFACGCRTGPARVSGLTTLLRPLHLEGRRRFGVSRGGAGALNGMRRQKVEKPFLEISAIDVYANDFSDGQVLVERKAVTAMQLYNLHQLAFERRRGLCDARRHYHPARSCAQLRELEFADTVRQGGGCLVHFLRKGTGDQIADKFAGRFDIGHRVLPPRRAEHDHWRVVAHSIEEAVRRKIHAALSVSSRNPADRSRRNYRLERIVREVVTFRRLVEVKFQHCVHHMQGAVSLPSLNKRGWSTWVRLRC